MPFRRSTRTEIVHIVVTGYQKKKEPSKYYVFVIDVTWNNSERFEVYRRYSDFFSFQTTLKAIFPLAAGRKNPTERVIPQLPKRIFVGRSHVARVAEARLEQINRYCQTLISLEPRISESAHVVGFFSPRIGDKELPKLHLHRPASLHPEKIPIGSMFEEYCALAEYVAEDGSQVSFQPGDKVLVMSKDQSGWWMCGVDGKVGWAPPSYLKKCEDKMNESDESDDDMLGYTGQTPDKDSDDSGVGDNSASEPNTPASSINSIGKFMTPEIKAEAYKAIDSYQADGPGQVSFEIGDTIHVLDKLEDGWWFVSNGRDEGWAPCSYLEGDREEESITSLNLGDVEQYYSVDNYTAEEDDEISFKKGVVMDVLKKSLDGWWVVKIDSVVGLAPATFLKKVESPECTDALQGNERKTSVSTPPADTLSPLPALSPFKAFQQPPRKQSVRARASMRAGFKPATKGAPAMSKLLAAATKPAGATRTTPSRTTPTANTSQSPPPRQRETTTPLSSPEVPTRPFPKPKKPGVNKKPKPIPARREIRTPSPESDSDPEQNYLNFDFQQYAISKQKSRSGSDASSKSSEKGGTLKPPIATPRKNSPRSKSVSGTPTETAAPPLPPRPMEDPEVPSRPPLPPRPFEKPRKQKSLTEVDERKKEEPSRPLRPRMSEIKRAKDRSRAANQKNPHSKNAPSLAVVDEDGFETMSNISSRTAASYTSSKSAPAYGRGDKRRSGTSNSEDGLLQAPVQRERRSSADNVKKRSLSVEQDGSSEGALNTDQVAGKLLSIIMTSEDPKLKAALKELITQDPSVASSIQGDH